MQQKMILDQQNYNEEDNNRDGEEIEEQMA